MLPMCCCGGNDVAPCVALVLCVVYGSALLSHCLLEAGLSDTVKLGGAGIDPEKGEREEEGG